MNEDRMAKAMLSVRSAKGPEVRVQQGRQPPKRIINLFGSDAGSADGSVKPDAGTGCVWLVGSGPGNPDLLTVRAVRLMQLADVVLHDHLVAPEIVAMVHGRAQRIYVGKERSNHSLPQDKINELLVTLARQGKRVLRLKGGDPFIFGRGGEELEALARHGIPFEVVPGVTAATGVAAYAGIPLTHRDHSHACVFVTGHLKDGTINLDWPALARPNQTVVVYMGLLGLPVLCSQLVLHGLPSTTPAAVIQHGTTRSQKVVSGTLASLPLMAVKSGLTPPTLIIVGEVVSLRPDLAWFDAGLQTGDQNDNVTRLAAMRGSA